MAEPQFWRTKEAARYLNVHPQTINQWLNPPRSKRFSSKLLGPKPPVIRFGKNCLRFPVEEFKKWADTFKRKAK